MWMTEDILEMMKKRREKKGTAEYKQIDKMMKKRCKGRKEEWYNSFIITIHRSGTIHTSSQFTALKCGCIEKCLKDKMTK